MAEPAGIEPVSLWRRTVTGAAFALIMLACMLLGNRYLALLLLCVAFAGIGADELYRVAAPGMAKVPRAIGLALATSLPVITYIARLHLAAASPVLATGGLAALTALFYSILAALLCYLAWVAVTPTSHIRDAAIGYFGALYLGIPLSCLILLREMNASPLLILSTVFSIWAADTFAYFGGSLLGRHKLAPVISPKKSWEGLICGTLGSIALWYLTPLVLSPFFRGRASILVAVLMGIVVSLSALLGDLFESRIKRDAGVKDSGSVLPGHGGILDRIDSLLFTSTLVFLLLSTVGVALGVVTP